MKFRSKLALLSSLLLISAPAWAGGSVGAVVGGLLGVGLAVFTGGASLLFTVGAIAGGAALGYMVGSTLEMILNPPSFDMPDQSDAAAQNQNAGVLVNKQGTNVSIPVVYGQRKVGGIRVFVASGGETNKYLYMAVVFAEGEIQEITRVFIDDTLVWQGASEHGTIYTPSEDNNFKSWTKFQIFHGRDDQAVSSLLQEATSDWDSNHRLQGLCYMAFRGEWPSLKTNEDRDNMPWAGIPSITVEMRGKKVMVPSSTQYQFAGLTYEQRRNFANRFDTLAYTEHPVPCLLDYLRNPKYGKGLSDDQIDWHSFYKEYLRWVLDEKEV
jgi:hypothetical protein